MRRLHRRCCQRAERERSRVMPSIVPTIPDCARCATGGRPVGVERLPG
ncbi:hypothetical protein KCP70_01125 [Salmonella enterica subsp. enterica]|nr:hypothetical protein KCP70_01125 [Salmonella enterica subsp. enterica]